MADELEEVSNRWEQNASESCETVLHAVLNESVTAIRARFRVQNSDSMSALPADWGGQNVENQNFILERFTAFGEIKGTHNMAPIRVRLCQGDQAERDSSCE